MLDHEHGQVRVLREEEGVGDGSQGRRVHEHPAELVAKLLQKRPDVRAGEEGGRARGEGARGEGGHVLHLRGLHQGIEVRSPGEEVGDPRVALEAQPLVQHGAPQVAIQDHGGLPGDRQQLGQVEKGGGLALLRCGPRHQHDLAEIALASEEEGRAEGLVGLGRNVDGVPSVAGDGGKKIEVEGALHVLAVLDRVGDVVPQEHVARSQDESDERPHERDPGLLGGEGSGGDYRPVQQTHVAVLDRGGDVRLVELLEEHGVQVVRGVRLLLERFELGELAALGHRLALLRLDGLAQLGLAALELAVLRAQPLLDLERPRLARFSDLVDLELNLLDLGVGRPVFLLEAREVDAQGLELAGQLEDHVVARHPGEVVQAAAALAHVGDLLELRLQGDAVGLGLHLVVVELADRARHRGDAPLGDEHLLSLVALEELVLGVLHGALGLGQPLVHPVVGALRRLHLSLDAVIDVDVGQGVRPEGRFLGVRVGDLHRDHERLGNGLHLEPAHEEPGRVGAALEGRLIGELEALHHPLRQGPGVEDVELGVEELAVPDRVARHHEGVRHVHGGGSGGGDLEQRAGPKLGRLHLGDQDREAEASKDRGQDEQPASPEEVRVVTPVHLPLRGERRSGRRQASHALQL